MIRSLLLPVLTRNWPGPALPTPSSQLGRPVPNHKKACWIPATSNSFRSLHGPGREVSRSPSERGPHRLLQAQPARKRLLSKAHQTLECAARDTPAPVSGPAATHLVSEQKCLFPLLMFALHSLALSSPARGRRKQSTSRCGAGSRSCRHSHAPPSCHRRVAA